MPPIVSHDRSIAQGKAAFQTLVNYRLLFIEHDFEWGGEWTDRKDYQHFEVPNEKIAEWYPENVE